MKVLVTRAQPANLKTCDALTKLGHEPISLPLFKLKDTGVSIPEVAFDGYIFTSSNAAQVLLQRNNLNLDFSKPAYCVGEKTAQVVTQVGFKKVKVADGNAQALADLIISKNPAPSTTLLYFTTKDRSFDLSSHLESHDIKVLNLEIYEIAPIKIEQDRLTKALAETTGGVILVYSKRSGEHLAQLLKRSNIVISTLNISLIAISQQAASTLKIFPWERFQIAPVANEQSMLHILNK